jgi:hypothetical protein
MHNEENIILEPLLSVNLNDIKVCKSPKKYLYNLLNIKFSICDKCSYVIYKNIKNDNHFKTCVTHTIHGVLMPYILLFTFEFTEITTDKDDLNQFDNLIKYRNNIKNFITNEFIISDSHYKLYALYVCQIITIIQHFAIFV